MNVFHFECGAKIYPTKFIEHPKGNVMHGLKASDPGFVDFGEAYFSTILHGETKGWKKHLRMSMNLLVPVGSIRFYLELDQGSEVEHAVLGQHNYCRLFVPPGVWLAFEGIGKSTNLLMNLASIEHDPTESVNRGFVP